MAQQIRHEIRELQEQRDAEMERMRNSIQRLKNLVAKTEMSYHVLVEEGLILEYDFQELRDDVSRLETISQESNKIDNS